MKFSVSMNNDTSVQYMQYGTPKQKAKARKFATASDRDLQKMAQGINANKHRDSKLSKGIATTILALPVIAGATAMAATKGKLSTKLVAGFKPFASTAGYMALGAGVVKANDMLAKKNPQVKEAEKKHPVATLLGVTAAAVGTAMGVDKIAKKVGPKVAEKLAKIGKQIKIEKLAQKIDAAPEGVKKVLTNLSEKVSLPKNVKEKLSTIGSKIKVPEFVKTGYKKITNLETTKKVVEGAKKVGRYAKQNPVVATIAVLGALIVADGVKRSFEISATKAKLKEDQLKTANALNEAYARENNSLKVSNAMIADKLDKANSIVSEKDA